MKRIIFLITYFTYAVTSLYAQEVGSFFLTPELGVVLSNLTKADLHPKVGFSGSVNLGYRATKLIGLSAGVGYTMEGARDGDAKLSPSYMMIPLLANIYVAKRTALETGFRFGINLGDNRDNFILLGDANSADFSIPLGLSVHVGHWKFKGLYLWGLTKAYENYDFKNSAFQLTIGYRIDL